MGRFRDNTPAVLAQTVGKIIAGLAIGVILPTAGCICVNNRQHMDNNIPVTVRDKLAELNEWESKHGNKINHDPNYDVPGEAAAYIETLKEELFSLGYDVAWDKDKYVLQKRR